MDKNNKEITKEEKYEKCKLLFTNYYDTCILNNNNADKNKCVNSLKYLENKCGLKGMNEFNK